MVLVCSQGELLQSHVVDDWKPKCPQKAILKLQNSTRSITVKQHRAGFAPRLLLVFLQNDGSPISDPFLPAGSWGGHQAELLENRAWSIVRETSH